MKRKYKLILSLICFILTIIFVIFGIMLFNNIPNVDLDLLDVKGRTKFAGTYISFFISFIALIGSFIFLCWAFCEGEN